VEANGHYAKDGSKNISYLTFSGGFKGSWGRLGAGYHYLNEDPASGDSKNNGIISAFGVAKIGKKTEIFARYDHLTDLNFKDIGDYIPVPAAQYKSRFLMAGLNYKIHKMIQVSPNVKYVFYNGDDAPDGDLYLNLTAKISFKTSIGKSKKK